MAYGGFNENHFWRDAWNSVKNWWNKNVKPAFNSWFKGFTGQELTPAQQEANAFSANEAEKQRQFEQQMSNTSYQRAVTDMQAAGLNPALMYGSGANGASTPTGSNASSVSPSTPTANPFDFLGSVASLAMQASKLKSEKSLMKAQENRENAEARRTEADADLKIIEKRFKPAQIISSLLHVGSEIEKNSSVARVNDAQVIWLQKQTDRYDELTDAKIAEMFSQIGLNDAQANVAKATYNKLVTEVEWLPRVYAASIAADYAAAGKSNAETKFMRFDRMKQVTLRTARSMGVNFKGFGISSSTSDDTLVLVCPTENGKSWDMIGFGAQDIESKEPSITKSEEETMRDLMKEGQ